MYLGPILKVTSTFADGPTKAVGLGLFHLIVKKLKLKSIAVESLIDIYFVINRPKDEFLIETGKRTHEAFMM